MHEIIFFNESVTDDESAKIRYYLSKKWGLTETVDSDGDGFIDATELAVGTQVLDATSYPNLQDFSDSVDAEIGQVSGLDAIESNLSLWLNAANTDFQDNSSIVDGGEIDQWLDLSGNGHHLTQSTSSLRPLMDSDGLNNSGVVQFDGSDDYLSRTTFSNWPVDDITIFIVQKSELANQSTISINGVYPTYGRFNAHIPWSDSKRILGLWFN